jgi:hypothetical protein
VCHEGCTTKGKGMMWPSMWPSHLCVPNDGGGCRKCQGCVGNADALRTWNSHAWPQVLRMDAWLAPVSHFEQLVRRCQWPNVLHISAQWLWLRLWVSDGLWLRGKAPQAVLQAACSSARSECKRRMSFRLLMLWVAMHPVIYAAIGAAAAAAAARAGQLQGGYKHS